MAAGNLEQSGWSIDCIRLDYLWCDQRVQA